MRRGDDRMPAGSQDAVELGGGLLVLRDVLDDLGAHHHVHALIRQRDVEHRSADELRARLAAEIALEPREVAGIVFQRDDFAAQSVRKARRANSPEPAPPSKSVPTPPILDHASAMRGHSTR